MWDVMYMMWDVYNVGWGDDDVVYECTVYVGEKKRISRLDYE